MVFCDATLCCLVSGFRCFEGIRCFHLQGVKVHEDEGQEPLMQRCSVTCWKTRTLNYISVNTSKLAKNEHFKHTDFPDFSVTSICSAVGHSCDVFSHLQVTPLINSSQQ